MATCSKSGCTRRSFIDSDRCIDHQPTDPFFAMAFISNVILWFALTGFGIWGIATLVLWVTSR